MCDEEMVVVVVVVVMMAVLPEAAAAAVLARAVLLPAAPHAPSLCDPTAATARRCARAQSWLRQARHSGLALRLARLLREQPGPGPPINRRPS